MADRIHDGLRWLTSEFSCTRDEFRQAHQSGADMLLDGMVSQGYAFHDRKQDRYAVSDAGRRRMAAVESPE